MTAIPEQVMVSYAAEGGPHCFTLVHYKRIRDEEPPRPNHYMHDSLGCPYECSEDHNHPEA